MKISQGRLSVQKILRELTGLPHRGAATPQGTEAARLLQTYLMDLGANVRIEPFQTPKTYATILHWLIGGLVAGLALVSITGVAVGFVWYFGFLAWKYFNWRYSFIVKFPVQHTAHNIRGRWPVRGVGEVARKVILMAHYDTAPVSSLCSAKQQANSRGWLIITLFLMLLAGMAATAEAIGGGVLAPYLKYLRYGLMIYFVLQAAIGTAGYWLKGYTNGANNNATGVAAALATADRIRQANIGNLDVEVVLTNAAEIGMIGAYYYVEAHKREWKRSQTLAINFDTLGAGKLTVIEQTGTLETIRYDNKATELARQLVDTEMFKDRVQMGRWHNSDFDSVWFVRNRIPVVALCALDADGQMPRIYQPDDTLDAVDLTPVENAVDFAEAVIKEWVMTDK